jgi:hypothetical protein
LKNGSPYFSGTTSVASPRRVGNAREIAITTAVGMEADPKSR